MNRYGLLGVALAASVGLYNPAAADTGPSIAWTAKRACVVAAVIEDLTLDEQRSLTGTIAGADTSEAALCALLPELTMIGTQPRFTPEQRVALVKRLDDKGASEYLKIAKAPREIIEAAQIVKAAPPSLTNEISFARAFMKLDPWPGDQRSLLNDVGPFGAAALLEVINAQNDSNATAAARGRPTKPLPGYAAFEKQLCEKVRASTRTDVGARAMNLPFFSAEEKKAMLVRVVENGTLDDVFYALSAIDNGRVAATEAQVTMLKAKLDAPEEEAQR